MDHNKDDVMDKEQAMDHDGGSEEIKKLRRKNQLSIGIIIALLIALVWGVVGTIRMHGELDDIRLRDYAANGMEIVDEKNDDATKAWNALQSANAPADATRDGGLQVRPGGSGTIPDGAVKVELYTDFMCPACGRLERSLGPRLQEAVDAGQIRLVLHPVAFLDQVSPDHYSTRAAAALAWVADHDAAHLLAVHRALYEQGFQPEEGSRKPVGKEALKAQLVKAGMDQDAAEQALAGDYEPWVAKATSYTTLRKDLRTRMDDGTERFSTPTLVVGNRRVALQKDAGATVKAFDDAVKAARKQ